MVELNKGILETSADTIRSEYGASEYISLDPRVRAFVNQTLDVSNDAPMSGFRMFFHFTKTQGFLAEETHVNSALAFLKRAGDQARYDLLKTFRKELSALNAENGWHFHTIEGLEMAYNRSKKNHQVVDGKLTVHCYETIDYRIQALVRMYHEIVFDYQRRVYVVPINLRKFSFSVYLYDARVTWGEPDLQGFDSPEITKVNHIMLDFGGVEIDDESNSELSSVSNSEWASHEASIVFTFNRTAVSGLFKAVVGQTGLKSTNLAVELFTSAITQNRNSERGLFSGKFAGVKRGANRIVTAKDVIIDPDYWKSNLDSVRTGLEASLDNVVEAGLNQLFLGNISGVSISDLESALVNDDLGTSVIRSAQGLRSLQNKEVGLRRYLQIN